MKKIITIFIMAIMATFAPASMFSQEVPDSSVVTVENRQGVFFRATTDYYPNELVRTEQRRLGDTTQAAQAIVGASFASLTEFAQKAIAVVNIAEQRRVINQATQALSLITGLNYFDVTDTLLSPEFLPDTLTSVPYRMRINGNAPVNVTLRNSAQGKLVMRQGATSFRVNIVTRDWIQLVRYDGTETPTNDLTVRVDLWQVRPGLWRDFSLRYTFTRL